MEAIIQTEKILLTITEAGQLLAIGRSHLYRLIENREIESISIGRSRRIPVKALQEFVDRLRSEQATFSEPATSPGRESVNE